MRYEKALAALPVPACPSLAQRPTETIDGYRSVEYTRYTAEIVTMKEEDVLSVTTYGTDGSAERRFFLLKDQYGMQVFQQEEYIYKKYRTPGKIYGAAIDSVYTNYSRRWWSSRVVHMYTTDESEDAIYRFLGKNEKAEDPFKLLVDRQAELREEKIQARDEKERAKLRDAFTGVDKEIPKEFKTYVEEVPLRGHRYFFYDYTGKQEQTGTCSYCLKRAALRGIRERKKGVCPHCGTSFIFYSAKRLYRTSGLVARRRAAFFHQVRAGRIVLRCCQVGISLRGGDMGRIEKTVWACEDVRIFLDGSGREIERYEAPEGTTKVYMDGLTRSWSGWSLSKHWIAPMELETLRKQMGIYTPLETLADYGLKANPASIFKAGKSRPELEYLIKMGLLGLAAYEFNVWKAEIGHGKYAGSIFLPGKSAAERLGVPGDMLPALKEADPSGSTFFTIRSLAKCWIRLRAQDMRDISDLGISQRKSDMLYAMAQECSIHKALKYIGRQAEIYKSDGNHVLQEWGDYIGMARELHMNLGDHCAMFPKNLKAAHEEAVKLIDVRKNEALNRKIKKTADRLRDLCWEYDGLTIRPAVSQGELFNEGQALSHCVGRMSYAEKQAEGETAIFFIRKAKTPDKSYVTLELDLKTWEKIQCYGKHDTYPGSEVSNFVKRWVSDIVKPQKCGEKKGAKTA